MTSRFLESAARAGLAWRKSSFSGTQNDCVEVSESIPGLVPVRDSKDPEGPALVFERDAFASFVAAVKSGQFSS